MRLGAQISGMRDDNAALRAEVAELRAQLERSQRFNGGGLGVRMPGGGLLR